MKLFSEAFERKFHRLRRSRRTLEGHVCVEIELEDKNGSKFCILSLIIMQIIMTHLKPKDFCSTADQSKTVICFLRGPTNNYKFPSLLLFVISVL